MKIATNIAGGLLGLLFVLFSALFFSAKCQAPSSPGSPIAHFMAAFGPTGYMTFVKSCELLGGILVAIPLTRNFGLLVLGPIIINILAFHHFITKNEGLFSPPILLIVALAAFLLWSGRKAFAGLRG